MIAPSKSTPAGFAAAHRVLLQAIHERAFPGAAYGVLREDEIFAVQSAGRFTYQPDALPVEPLTVFDMASVSKVMATTSMAMLLWQRRQLNLDRPVADILPDFVRFTPPDSPKRFVTPRMLLAHSSGLPAYERLYQCGPDREALLNACLRMPLETDPDSRAVYSDIGFIVLGHLLEKLAGESLDTFCQREVFLPLGMASTLYCPPAEMRSSIPPTRDEDRLGRGYVQGEVHDDNCWRLGGISGHAGLFSNVADTLRFAQCILRKGSPVFDPEAIDRFTARQAFPAPTSRALGWDTPSKPSSSGDCFSLHSVGHLGYTGTSVWIDMEKHLAVVLLTNRTFPGDEQEGISQRIQQVRPLFHNAMMEALNACK